MAGMPSAHGCVKNRRLAAKRHRTCGFTTGQAQAAGGGRSTHGQYLSWRHVEVLV